jgi:hypothetical protein
VLVGQREFIHRVFGDDTPQVIYFFFARWNSILISLLILAVAYRLGRAMAGPLTGLAFALILTMEPVAALEVGWIIKVDNMAFLLSLLALLMSVYAVQRREWRWIGVSVLLAVVATITKYNMIFVLLAPGYAALYLMTRRATLSFVLMNVLVIGGLWGGWTFLNTYWSTEVTPRFYHCVERRGDEPNEDILPDRRIEVLPCGPFFSFQQYASPFYQRSQFWDATVDQSFDHIIDVLRDDLKLAWLLIGGGAVVAQKEEQVRQMALLIGAVVIPTLAVFAITGIAYPPRQYYVLILGVALLVALGIGSLARRDWRIYAVLLVGMSVSFGWDAVRARRELLKPDTRVATAEYFLHHARQGETIVVEYDHVEFAQQYGGFPKPEGYFNIIGLGGLFDLDAERLYDDQIYYVVVDERARGENSAASHDGHLPEGFERVLDLSSDAYYGPARSIYRTFSPEHPLSAHFEDVAVLHGYDLLVEDDQLHLKFYWQAQATDLPDYTLFVHIVDSETGETVVQRDAPPERHTAQWDQYEWVFDERLIPLDIAPGSYTVQIGLYESLTLERLPVDGDSVGVLMLMDFTIE